MRINHTLIAGLLLLASCFISPAEASTVDCNNAKNTDEKLICSNLLLRQWDVHLDKILTETMSVSAAPLVIKAAQDEWIRSVRQRCIDSDCLARAYAIRTEKLRKQGDDLKNPVTPVPIDPKWAPIEQQAYEDWRSNKALAPPQAQVDGFGDMRLGAPVEENLSKLGTRCSNKFDFGEDLKRRGIAEEKHPYGVKCYPGVKFGGNDMSIDLFYAAQDPNRAVVSMTIDLGQGTREIFDSVYGTLIEKYGTPVDRYVFQGSCNPRPCKVEVFFAAYQVSLSMSATDQGILTYRDRNEAANARNETNTKRSEAGKKLEDDRKNYGKEAL